MRGRAGADLAPERASDPEAVREAALRLLERTRRTRSDLVRRLRDKGFATTAIDPVVERLAAVGLVDDVEYARAFLASRWSRRSAGWRRLEMELRKRGVSTPDVAAARTRIEAEVGTADDLTAARRVLSQVSRRYAALDPRVRRQRLYALLARRGFDGEAIRRALEEDDRDS
jgi:regulatory protein